MAIVTNHCSPIMKWCVSLVYCMEFRINISLVFSCYLIASDLIRISSFSCFIILTGTMNRTTEIPRKTNKAKMAEDCEKEKLFELVNCIMRKY